MKILVKLFLPNKMHNDIKYINSLIERMDSNDDGVISFEEFVDTLKETGYTQYYR